MNWMLDILFSLSSFYKKTYSLCIKMPYWFLREINEINKIHVAGKEKSDLLPQNSPVVFESNVLCFFSQWFPGILADFSWNNWCNWYRCRYLRFTINQHDSNLEKQSWMFWFFLNTDIITSISNLFAISVTVQHTRIHQPLHKLGQKCEKKTPICWPPWSNV